MENRGVPTGLIVVAAIVLVQVLITVAVAFVATVVHHEEWRSVRKKNSVQALFVVTLLLLLLTRTEGNITSVYWFGVWWVGFWTICVVFTLALTLYARLPLWLRFAGFGGALLLTVGAARFEALVGRTVAYPWWFSHSGVALGLVLLGVILMCASREFGVWKKQVFAVFAAWILPFVPGFWRDCCKLRIGMKE